MLPLELRKYHRANFLLSPRLSFTAVFGVVGMVLLETSLSPAIAQIPISQVNMLFVNPSVGNDKVGNGSKNAPLKTITQALQLAQPNTVIILTPGSYNTKTGEIFPLILKPGVSIQGSIENKGTGIIITGGGQYLSRSFGSENVTIVSANQAGLSGVTVTNTNPRGYGLLIESSNPIVQDNTFTDNTQDGILVAGNANPTISKNYFLENGANGITIAGTSQPQIRGNIFQQTGFGINITQDASPMVVGNQIEGNRSGIIVQAKARPILRQNLIQGSREDGLVAIAHAVPDLGNSSEPGGNEFLNNTRYDINAKAAKELITAAGNNLNQTRIVGRVDVEGTTVPTVSRYQGLPLPKLSALKMPQIQNPPTDRELVFSSETSQSIPPSPSQFNYVKVKPDNDGATPPLGPMADDTRTIEFTAPQAPPLRRKTYRTRSRVSTSGVRYRVVIPITNEKQRDLVRSVVPDAFTTVWQGRTVMQAGIYSSRAKASVMLRKLNRKGLKAVITPFN